MGLEQTLTVAELAKSFGVSHRLLRLYEDRGLLQPQRVGTSRYYCPRDVVRLQLILKGKKLGFSLGEIGRLILAHETPARESRLPDDGVLDATTDLSRGQIAAKLATLEAERRSVDKAIVELRGARDRTPRKLTPA